MRMHAFYSVPSNAYFGMIIYFILLLFLSLIFKVTEGLACSWNPLTNLLNDQGAK